jgi:hypothetical protein
MDGDTLELMTIAELRDLADGRGVAIPVGPKAAIIAALLEPEAAEVEPETEPVDEPVTEPEPEPEPETEPEPVAEQEPVVTVQAGGWVIGERGGWVPRGSR